MPYSSDCRVIISTSPHPRTQLPQVNQIEDWLWNQQWRNRIENIPSGCSLHYELHFHQHNTNVWHQACWTIIFILITAVAFTTVASHTHCHFKPLFKEHDKSIVSPARKLTWKELLAYSISIRFTIRSRPVRSKKTSRLYLLDWTLPPVLTERLHIKDHLVLGVYNPLHPQNTFLIQTVTHACCHFVMRDKERSRSPTKGSTSTPWTPPNSLYFHVPFLYLTFLTQLNNGSLCAHSFIYLVNFFYMYIIQPCVSKYN